VIVAVTFIVALPAEFANGAFPLSVMLLLVPAVKAPSAQTTLAPAPPACVQPPGKPTPRNGWLNVNVSVVVDVGSDPALL
jgi:hypothetical protein